nr:nickel pincer cofactor biosynthesis protein LarC [uncultured Desulfobulbus sp.]
MNILYYDCFAGISGDMNLAAMIDLGVDPQYLRSELSKLGIDDEFALQVSREARNGIHGTRVDVGLQGQGHAHKHPHDHAHSYGDPHMLEEHEHQHHKDSAHPHVHGLHRNFADIRDLIQSSSLDDAVKTTSLAIFQRVTEAEARVHGKTVEEVHFHEVGATDSLIDIVGAAICFHRLQVDAVWASSPELGGGFVRCAHGLMPVPAPATVEVLHNIPTRRGATDHEATTPTGAAILAALVDEFTDAPVFTTTKTGYGIGHRETERPNVLRVHLAQVTASSQQDTVQARLLQCNIDDMTGEHLGDMMELLMEHGAMDVHFTPIMMKKNRPAIQISLLCSVAEEERFKLLLFRHTTTLGIKSFPLEKTVLERRLVQVETPLGPVTVKQALLEGKVIHAKPEFEQCKEIARRNDLTLAEVYALIGKCAEGEG